METRRFWVDELIRMIDPVLSNMAQNIFKEHFRRQEHPKGTSKAECAYLEAFARVLCGTTAWFNAENLSEEEYIAQQKYLSLTKRALRNAVDKEAKDFVYIKDGEGKYVAQMLVDTAFLALALLRAKEPLWDQLEEETKQRIIYYFKETRAIKPNFSNWLLFSGMVETFLYSVGEDCDWMRIDYCFKQFEQWYLGDGIYSDGPYYREDYYNSYVIVPFLVEMVRHLGERLESYEEVKEKIYCRAQRYALIQEGWINCDGTFNAIGRSIAYRCGAFHHLAMMAWYKLLPKEISPEQTRCALTAVIRKCTEAESTYTKEGFLSVGLYGYQPDLREVYISGASLYLATFAFLPLGLESKDQFWKNPDVLYTMQKVWTGVNMFPDHAID